jgi:hypothetical protein
MGKGSDSGSTLKVEPTGDVLDVGCEGHRDTKMMRT